jgi:dienelactone hydrolase
MQIPYLWVHVLRQKNKNQEDALTDLDKIAEEFKARGISSLGCSGFCWGGTYYMRVLRMNRMIVPDQRII